MRLSTTLFLAVILSGLGLYYFGVEKPALRTGPEIFSPKILNLADGDSLSFLQLQSQASTEKIGLKRKGSDWVLVAPVYYPAESFLVEGMIQALAFSRRERRFSSRSPSAKEFGFDSPVIRISIKTEQHPDPRTLLVGAESPMGAGFYARWEEEDEIFLVSPQLKASFERTAYSLRKKKLFRLNWDTVTWLYVKSGTKKFRLEKKASQWRWVIPAPAGEIPLEKAMDLIYSFQSLYIREFFDGKRPEEKEFGLQAKEVVISAGGELGTEEKLIVGATAKGKDALFALRENENLVILVSEKNLKSLLEQFEVSFQEFKIESSKKASGNSGTDRASGRKSPEKPL